MLTILGKNSKYCDGIKRRSFLKIGGLSMSALGGINISSILQAQSNNISSNKSIINIYLAGGPPHLDMWDIKENAPSEIRGEFSAIDTIVSGIRIGECFPQLASVMDKIAIVRSVVGSVDAHDAFQCMTGYERKNLESIGGRPSIGSVLSKVYGPKDLAIPPCVALAEKTQHVPWSEGGSCGFLGSAYSPFNPNGNGMDDLILNGITLDQLQNRKLLLNSLDRFKKVSDFASTDSFNDAAFGVLTSSKLAEALDITKESDLVRARYGDGKPYNYQYDGASTDNSKLLIARRLIESGVRSVTLSYGRWDSHGQNFALVRDHGAKLDQCLSALILDLEERGLLSSTLVLVWGEFGRTPRINKDAGRDHWPLVNSCLLIGGGIKTGQVIGSTNRLGEMAETRPVHMQEIVSTVYKTLGIDCMNFTLNDPTGRPQFLVDKREHVTELF